jgi:NitT/TauT family transport system substrate-binding protein
VLRRRFIADASALATSVVAGAGATCGLPSFAGEEPAGSVRLGYLGNPCEAVTFVAPTSRVFRKHNLTARLVPFSSEPALIQALGAGHVDAASLKLAAMLVPLARGSDVRVVAGLHTNCLRVLAPDDVATQLNGTLKGAVIATDRLHGASMNLLWALLRRQRVDAKRDVTWRVFGSRDIAALEASLADQSVQLVAAADPLAYSLLADHMAEPYANFGENGFSCGDGIGGGHHCFLALSGRLTRRHPTVAASLTRAYLESSAEVGRRVGPAAQTESQNAFVGADLRETIGMLSSYDWRASTDLVLQELELTANDFRRAGLLSASTDPERLAERAYVDVLHA